MSVCVEKVIYKHTSIHNFSEHMPSELIRSLPFQEKLLQISYMFLWVENWAIMVDTLRVPESIRAPSQAVPLRCNLHLSPQGQRLLVRLWWQHIHGYQLYSAEAQLLSPAGSESPSKSERVAWYSLGWLQCLTLIMFWLTTQKIFTNLIWSHFEGGKGLLYNFA